MRLRLVVEIAVAVLVEGAVDEREEVYELRLQPVFEHVDLRTLGLVGPIQLEDDVTRLDEATYSRERETRRLVV